MAGAGLVFLTTFLDGGPQTKTLTETSTLPTTVTATTTATSTLTEVTTLESTTTATLVSTQIVTIVTTYATTESPTGPTATAQISVTQTALVHGAALALSGSLVASNTGTSNVAVDSISLTYGGQTCTPVTTGLGTVAAGSSLTITLGTQTATSCGTVSSSGEQFTGSLSLSNGGSAQFTGTFQ
jgi:hypothetical protein